jgi:hypothetical protein
MTFLIIISAKVSFKNIVERKSAELAAVFLGIKF